MHFCAKCTWPRTESSEGMQLSDIQPVTEPLGPVFPQINLRWKNQSLETETEKHISTCNHGHTLHRRCYISVIL